MLVRAVIYEEYFLQGLLPELKSLTELPIMEKAMLFYQRKRKADSRLIPPIDEKKETAIAVNGLALKSKRLF